MTSPILSQDEINALLHQSSFESLSSGLKNVLTTTTQNMGQWIGRITGSTDIGGPHIERVAQGLDQYFTDEVAVIVADLGESDVVVLMSLADAKILGERMKMESLQAFQTLSQMWIAELANRLNLTHRLYQVQTVNPSSLVGQAVSEKTVLVRHLIEPNSSSLEFSMVIKSAYLEQQISKQVSSANSFINAAKFKPSQTRGKLIKGNASPVSAASFSPLELPIQEIKAHSIDLLEDIDLSITVELGRVVLTLNEVLELKPQAVIRLDRHAGEPVDVYINANRAAKGEVVVLEEYFGVRILEILPKSERIRGE